MPIRRAVIPAAGWGTRMLPAAKAVPKELLPVLGKPVIQYVVEECAAAGVEDVLLISARGKRAIEDHFDRDAELERRLAESGKAALLDSVVRLSERVRIHSVRQAEQRGLGDAVMQARAHVGQEAFVCLLGDTVFSAGDREALPAQQLAAAYARIGTALIGLEEVPSEKVSRYGIAGGTMIEPGLMRIETLVEKPSAESAPSRYAIAARYVLTPAVFDCLERTAPGKGGEIQLTDALRLLLEREVIHGVVLKARRHDVGSPVDWLKTNLLFAQRDAALWAQIRQALEELM